MTFHFKIELIEESQATASNCGLLKITECNILSDMSVFTSLSLFFLGGGGCYWLYNTSNAIRGDCFLFGANHNGFL